MIETERLKLIPLSLEQLKCSLEDLAQLGAALNLNFASDLINEPVTNAITMKIEKMAEVDESAHPFFTYWLMAIREQSLGVGFIGYKGSPDENCEIEIGYGISSECRNKGYTTEAAIGLIDWAFQDSAVQTITAINVLKSNIPSIRILEKLGFEIFDEGPGSQHWRLTQENWEKTRCNL